MIIYNVAAAFLDAVIDSIIIQQARIDPINGQQNLKLFSLISYGIGATLGGLVAAVATEYYTPYHAFMFGSLVCFGITIAGFFTSDTIDTNIYANFEKN